MWGAEGKDTATLDAFFTELGGDRAGQLQAVSMDMGAAFNKSVRDNAPQAVACIDALCETSHNGSYVQLRIMWRGGSAPRWGLVVGPR